MAYPLGPAGLCTLRATAHWHANLFVITRRGGGVPLRFSDLDRPIQWRGHTYIPTAGERFDEEQEATMAAGSAQFSGAISPRTITSVDIQRGVYDNARVDQFLVDWKRGKLYRHDLWFVDEISHEGGVWVAALTSSAAFLQASIGETYSTICPAVLGDGKCKKVVATVAMTVSSVTDVQIDFNQTTNTGIAQDWFRYGSIEWTAGNNRGSLSRVRSSTTAGNFKLSTPTRFPIRVGDTFVARPGCDGLATTCKDKFDNLANYRGNERQKNAKQLIVNRGSA